MPKPILPQILHRLVTPRTQLAIVTLFAVLQKSPAILRSFNSVKYSVEPATRILQKLTLAAASLGSYHALSGATIADFTASTGGSPETDLQSFNVSIPGGENFQLVFSLQKVDGEGRTPGSWSVEGTPPEGMIVQGFRGLNTFPLNNQNYFNAPNGTILGTPTESGTFELRFKPWEDPDKDGRSAEPFLITLTVTGINPPAPIAPEASIQDQTGTFLISWSAEEGQTYELQSSVNPLDETSWAPFPANIKTESGKQSVTLEKSTVPATLILRVASQNPQ